MRWQSGCLAGLLAGLVMIAVPGASARADDVTDQIAEALDAYRKKDLATAMVALEAALNLLRQNRADAWKLLLPAAPKGWTSTDDDTTISTAAMLGGGTGATRRYARGDESVEVMIMAESPLAQSMAAMLGNPAMAALAGRVVVIGGRRFTYVKDDNAYIAIVADRAMVRIQGSRGVPDAELRGFVTALPFADIEKAVR